MNKAVDDSNQGFKREDQVSGGFESGAGRTALVGRSNDACGDARGHLASKSSCKLITALPWIKDNVLNMSSSVLSSPAQKIKSGDACWTILLTNSPLLVPEGRTSKFFFPEMTSMFLCLSNTNSKMCQAFSCLEFPKRK